MSTVAPIEPLEVGDLVEVTFIGHVHRGTIRMVVHLGPEKAAKLGPLHYLVELDESLTCAGGVLDPFELGWQMTSDRWSVASPAHTRRVSLLDRLAAVMTPSNHN